MICSECAQPLRDEATFCDSCGADQRLEANEKPSYKKRRGLTLIVIGLLAGLLGYYLISPYFQLDRVRRALLHGDSETLASLIDFPAVREDIRAQLSAEMLKTMVEMKDNPFSGLGMAIGTGLVNTIVDNLFTPSGLIAMTRGQGAEQKNAATNGAAVLIAPHLASASHFTSPTTFEIRVPSETKSVALKMKWDAYRWRIVGIELAIDHPRESSTYPSR